MKTLVLHSFYLLFLVNIPLAAHNTSDSRPAQEIAGKQEYWDHIDRLYTLSCTYEHQDSSGNNAEKLTKVLSITKPSITPDAHQDHLISLIKDLHVVYGTDEHAMVHLLSKIDRTKTLCGRAALCYQLTNPTTDIATLKQKQAITWAFVADPALLADCQESLKKIQENEQKLLDFLLQDKDCFSEEESLYLPTMTPWATTGKENLPTRLLKKTYTAFAAVNNSIARKVNNSEIPYVGSYALESLMWWRKFWAFWPIGLQIGATALVHAYYHPITLAIDERDNAILATISSLHDHIQPMSPEQWHDFYKHNPQPIADQKQYLQKLDTLRQEYMQITKVGIDSNHQLAKIPGLITQQAQENRECAHQKLADLPSFARRAFNATGTMANLLFNPAHPSKMTFLGSPLRTSQYNTLSGYAVKFINFLIIAAINFGSAAQVKKTVEGHTDTINKMRICLCTIRDIESARQELYERLSQTEIFTLLTEHHALSGQQLSPTCTHALEILQSADLDKSFGVFTFGAGDILTAYKNLREVKDELRTLMRGVAEVDCYVALAQLYNEQTSSNAPYTFAAFIDSPQASLELDDVWNPFINIKEVVSNNVSIGQHGGYNHMLLTGSNTGGKSTFLRSIALAVLMAQTVGIVPASYARLTPFNDIVVLLNVSDDPTNKESTFAAEGSRAHGLLQRINNLTENQRALIVIDELFKGTSHQEGLKWASAVTHYLARSKHNIITLFATHFHELTNLEKSIGDFKNYHLDAQRTTRSGGGYTCAYRLQEGPCAVNIASDIMHQKLDEFDMGDIEGDLQRLVAHAP